MARDRLTVPWLEFEPLFLRLRKSLGDDVSQTEALHLMGYKSSGVSNWRAEDKVPLLAFYAVKWCLHDLGIRDRQPRPVPMLTIDELSLLFSYCLSDNATAAIAGQHQLPPATQTARQRIMAKLATIMSQMAGG